MDKKTIITTLLAIVAIAGQGQVKCHVTGTVAEGTKAVGLVIYRDGTDPKDSSLKLAVKDGRFECDVEDTGIERWHIVDFGEVLEKGMTSRSDAFFSEDGATVTISLDGDKFKSIDAMRKAVERNSYPWPCLVDLDDEFGVFKKHGTANSALFLIDRDGTIIAVPNSVEELEQQLKKNFKDK